MSEKEYKFCLVKTPMRLSLAGGGTDFPELFPQIGHGSVLSCAIDSYVYTSVRLLNHKFHKKIRVEYSNVEMASSVQEIKNNIVRGVLTKLNCSDVLQVNVISDIPGGSGLGGSSVFCVSLVHALNSLNSFDTSPKSLAFHANEVELKTLGRKMGLQDALPAAYGGLRHYRMKSIDRVEEFNLSNPILVDYINQNIRLIWTEEHRNSETILSGQITDIAQNIDLYKELRDLTESAVQKLKNEVNADVIHTTLESTVRSCHEIKQIIASGVVSPSAKQIIRKLNEINVLGYRVVGAGNGGFILAIINPDNEKAFEEKFEDHVVIAPSISTHGSLIEYIS